MSIAVRHTESGDWAIYRDETVTDIYPSFMWHQALRTARQEATRLYLPVIGNENT